MGFARGGEDTSKGEQGRLGWSSRFQAPTILTLVAWAPPPQVALLAPGLPSVEGVKIVPSPTLPVLQTSTLVFARFPHIPGAGTRATIQDEEEVHPHPPTGFWGFWSWHQGLLLLINSLVTTLLLGPTDQCHDCHQETGLGAAW